MCSNLRYVGWKRKKEKMDGESITDFFMDVIYVCDKR